MVWVLTAAAAASPWGDDTVVAIPDSDSTATWRPNGWNGNIDKDPRPVPDEDLYVLAAETEAKNVSKTFDWWVYDHTRNYNARYNTTNLRRVDPIIDPINHYYIPNDTSGAQTGNSPGRPQDTNPNQLTSTATGSTYTPPASMYSDPSIPLGDPSFLSGRDDTDLLKNPDVDMITGNAHPYQGNYRHMISSNGGARMDFYGYSQRAYKDFRYLPNTDGIADSDTGKIAIPATLKTFEFDIAENLAYDALDGVGFFFNTTITGDNYEDQTMTGYLIFFTYGANDGISTGRGVSMDLYKFKNLDVSAFRDQEATRNIASYVGGTNFVKVATAPIYGQIQVDTSEKDEGDKSRHIKIEASPDTLTVYYVGSSTKNDPSIIGVPINEKDAAGYPVGAQVPAVQWTIQSGNGSPDPLNNNIVQANSVDYICLDTSKTGSTPNYIQSYGYGPMASYISHTCARPTNLALLNLSMTTITIKPLADVVKMPRWHENTMKYLVNLNENIIEDFDEDNNAAATLLSNLMNDDIYYMGWGNSINAYSSAGFLRKNNLKGAVVDMRPIAELQGNGTQNTHQWLTANGKPSTSNTGISNSRYDADPTRAYMEILHPVR